MDETNKYGLSVQQAETMRNQAMQRLGALGDARARWQQKMIQRQEEEMRKAEATRKKYEKDRWKRVGVSALGTLVGGTIGSFVGGGPAGAVIGAGIGGTLANEYAASKYGGPDTSGVSQTLQMGFGAMGQGRGIAGADGPELGTPGASDYWNKQYSQGNVPYYSGPGAIQPPQASRLQNFGAMPTPDPDKLW